MREGRIREDVVEREEPVPVVEHEDERQPKDAEHVQREREEEEEEVAVVTPPHAVVHPRAVVVERLQHTPSSYCKTAAAPQHRGTAAPRHRPQRQSLTVNRDRETGE